MDDLMKRREAENMKRLDEEVLRISHTAVGDGMRLASVLNRLLAFVATEYTKTIGASATADIFRTCADTIDASDFGKAAKAKHYKN